ncbi:MAG: hypothetical protein QOH35_496, partial [Acidobacteriaceae bacterium]|nr:hypothetical protein [Acidobacteriaceae bacterium]
MADSAEKPKSRAMQHIRPALVLPLLKIYYHFIKCASVVLT